MTKTNILFACSNCGAQYPAWQGRCTECQAWGSIHEEVATGEVPSKRQKSILAESVVSLESVRRDERPYHATGVEEFDRVLSGGLVGGSLTLLGGNPGVGKSTLILQVAANVAQAGDVLYVSGEESKEQLKLRYVRLGLSAPKLHVLTETDVEGIVTVIEQRKPALAIVDSVQTVTVATAEGEAGGITQIKASTVRLLECAKRTGTAIVLVGHVTKEGFVAGPKMLEHLVDTVLYLEGDETQSFRLLRTAKHRFGVTDEVGVFSMTDRGLETVKNPSELFLLENRSTQAGTAITAVLEGTRPFVVEVQALVSPTALGFPRRLASGFDRGRLELLIAVLTKRTGLKLATQDVHVNLVGGLKVREPAIDLAVCMAVASGFLDQALDPSLLCIGEVGLGGEVRPVVRVEQRLSEAAKLGFQTACIAKASDRGRKKTHTPSLTVVPVQTLAEAMITLFKKRG